EATNGREAAVLAAELKPDVVLMDLLMPECDGVEATQRISRTDPGINVVILTGIGTEDKLLAAVRAGALGYLRKDADTEALTQAVRQVARGGSWLPPDLT